MDGFDYLWRHASLSDSIIVDLVEKDTIIIINCLSKHHVE